MCGAFFFGGLLKEANVTTPSSILICNLPSMLDKTPAHVLLTQHCSFDVHFSVWADFCSFTQKSTV